MCAIVALLAGRQLPVSSGVRTGLVAAQELEQLEAGLTRAATVDNADELFWVT